MALSTIPAQGSTAWYNYMKETHDAINALLASSGGSAFPTPVSPLPVITSPTRTVNVSDRDSLVAALVDIRWGDKINIAAGQYGDAGDDIVITSPSMAGYSASNPPKGIWIVGPVGKTAVINRGTTASGYALHLDGANYAQVENLKIIGGQKGVMVDETNFSRLINCDIGFMGQEAVHYRNFSSDNLIQGCIVHDSGQTGDGSNAEGIYFGQANTNWDASYSRTAGKPDTSNRNSAIGNTLTNIKAELFDVKEGTTGGVIKDNTGSGSAIAGNNDADSYIDVKGNDYLVEGNTFNNPSSVMVHAITTHINYAGYGNRNVFKDNTLVAGGKTGTVENSTTGSQGINILTSGSRGSAVGNVVYSDNVVTGAPGGKSNIPVTNV